MLGLMDEISSEARIRMWAAELVVNHAPKDVRPDQIELWTTRFARFVFTGVFNDDPSEPNVTRDLRKASERMRFVDDEQNKGIN